MEQNAKISQENSDEQIELLKAAKSGDAHSQYELGFRYAYGMFGVELNDTEAFKWFMKSAEQGNDSAQFELAESYYNGWGVEQDYSEAAKWYRKAAEQGLDFAQTKLGICYLVIYMLSEWKD